MEGRELRRKTNKFCEWEGITTEKNVDSKQGRKEKKFEEGN
jgi:hypothetical protein